MASLNRSAGLGANSLAKQELTRESGVIEDRPLAVASSLPVIADSSTGLVIAGCPLFGDVSFCIVQLASNFGEVFVNLFSLFY